MNHRAPRPMAVELGPLRHPPSTQSSCGGRTPLLKTFMGEDTPERRAQFLATIPLRLPVFHTPRYGQCAAFLVLGRSPPMITAWRWKSMAGALQSRWRAWRR